MICYIFRKVEEQSIFSESEEGARKILRERDPLHESEYELMDAVRLPNV